VCVLAIGTLKYGSVGDRKYSSNMQIGTLPA